MQNWKKLGLIYSPDGKNPWMKTHAANPIARHLQEDVFRIYFSGRDAESRAHISYIDIDIKEPQKILHTCEAPALGLGQIGAFDDRGVSMGCILQVGTETRLYYLGWNLGKDVPFRNALGMAIEQPNGQFERYSIGPLLERSMIDPFSLSYPFVLKDEGKYKMWYGSHQQWGKTTNDMIHCTKYAESEDGIHWKATGNICLNTTTEHYAFSKPSVLKDGDTYKMWYSYRGGNYRIGYAESKDGINWTRKDEEVGLKVTEGAWDSDMLCYAHVFDHQGKRYMLYNGNAYGLTGIGLALLD